MSIQQSKTSAFLNEANEKTIRTTIGNTSNSYATTEPYGMVLPSNIDVFSSLTTSFLSLEDTEVVKQVREVLLNLYLSLRKAGKHKPISNYLSRMNLVQQEDKAALLEWNFQDFRVGFTLEPDRTESSYFVVSQNKNAGSFMADTQKLDTDVFRLVDKIVEYVLENT